MNTLRVNDHDLAFTETGSGRPIVMIHGSLCDCRYWTPQTQSLGARGRAIAISLRRCWPESWDGHGEGYSIAQHVDDVVAFLRALGTDAVDLVGHSRGGLIALRVAQREPSLVRKLVLAEPGAFPDASLGDADEFDFELLSARIHEAARRISGGDIDDGLAYFIDGLSGIAIWKQTVPSFKNMARANANTLIAQAREPLPTMKRLELIAMDLPTLLVGGALTPHPFPKILDVLHAHIRDAMRVTIPGARHAMNLAAPARFNSAVLEFLA